MGAEHKIQNTKLYQRDSELAKQSATRVPGASPY